MDARCPIIHAGMIWHVLLLSGLAVRHERSAALPESAGFEAASGARGGRVLDKDVCVRRARVAPLPKTPAREKTSFAAELLPAVLSRPML